MDAVDVAEEEDVAVAVEEEAIPTISSKQTFLHVNTFLQLYILYHETILYYVKKKSKLGKEEYKRNEF